MKALHKEQWDTKSRTLDKGILRPKGSKSSKKVKRPPLGHPLVRKEEGSRFDDWSKKLVKPQAQDLVG